MLKQEDTLLTVAEVARLLKQSEVTVRRKIYSGELEAMRLGSSPKNPYRVSAEELDRWLAGHRSGEAA
jgi:excisionase family DNA binding protein